MTRRPKEKLSYLKFFPTDWRSDPRLRMCSAAARGLWVEMMCLMHEAEPYGHLLVSGQRPTDAQLAVLAGIPPDQVSDLLGELEAAGVFSRTGQGAIYSRRMTRDEKKRRIARKNGKSGGNPSLGNNKGNTASDNQTPQGQDKTQRPEARGQSKKGGGATRARPREDPVEDEAPFGKVEPKKPPPKDPAIDRIVEAAQADVRREGWWDPSVAQSLRRWRALNLSDDEIVETVTQVAAKYPPGHAKTPAFFDDALARAAGRKAAPPLSPIDTPAPQQRRTRADDRFARLAARFPDGAEGREAPDEEVAGDQGDDPPRSLLPTRAVGGG